ncbi:MAG: glycosyltransferase family 9 protein [Bacteroidetes bacterium]|nr:glycosyltransferase family 9 protein [Bacteroidota bacterium]
MQSFLLIQTAFIGDVILATPLIEKLSKHFPEARIDFLLRKGNETLLKNNPHLHEVLVWDKKHRKHKNLIKNIRIIRNRQYDYVINLQRFFSTALFTVLSGAENTIGFDKNPLSFLFSKKIKHQFGDEEQFVHEVDRNLSLIEHLTDTTFFLPRLYPSLDDFQKMNAINRDYICIAPTSVWFTKQYPAGYWVKFINLISENIKVYLLGGPADREACEKIKKANSHPRVKNLAGELSFLESAALMKNARMNYVNDSAPLHIASSVNAPVTAIFCSTVPRFGFTPLSQQSKVLGCKEELDCRPCGLHGFKKCPKGHFKCADIEAEDLLNQI